MKMKFAVAFCIGSCLPRAHCQEVLFVRDTGESHVVTVDAPIDLVAGGVVSAECDFSLHGTASGSRIDLVPLRVLWSELDGQGRRLERGAQARPWHGVEEFVQVKILDYSERTGLGRLRLLFPIGGAPGHTNYRRFLLHYEVKAIEVAIVMDHVGLDTENVGDGFRIVGSTTLPLFTSMPEVWLGLSSGIFPSEGSEPVSCFLYDTSEGSSGSTYQVSVIPQEAGVVDGTSVQVGPAGCVEFTFSPTEPGSFRLQAMNELGSVWTSRLYEVRGIVERSVSGTMSIGDAPDSPTDPFLWGKRCIVARAAKTNLNGLFSYCKTPCVRVTETPPSINCVLEGEGPASLYSPGRCISGSVFSGCTLIDVQIPGALLELIAEQVTRSCADKYSASGGFTIGGEGVVGGQVIVGEPDDKFVAACCIYRRVEGSAVVTGSGRSCQ
jgi:hypothetical protein